MSNTESQQPIVTSGKQLMFRLAIFIAGMVAFLFIVKYFLG